VTANSPCETAIEVMRDRGFDQLPVLAPSGRKLVLASGGGKDGKLIKASVAHDLDGSLARGVGCHGGDVTLGNVLSRLTHGRATGQSPVSEVMFDFSKISERCSTRRSGSGH
jgi:cystathionine beta-synthase